MKQRVRRWSSFTARALATVLLAVIALVLVLTVASLGCSAARTTLAAKECKGSHQLEQLRADSRTLVAALRFLLWPEAAPTVPADAKPVLATNVFLSDVARPTNSNSAIN